MDVLFLSSNNALHCHQSTHSHFRLAEGYFAVATLIQEDGVV